ncbi:MAG: hypothetical protein LUB59_06070 [Candidatus Gastranaerophilales bacterium]|nr:hypothetical protein [Candidatus Gastranaerophilales bacterium]
MGMAASQARYLSLVARKSNTEYEGQQINQQRVVLSNQTADLFNQMLTMSVPTCPDSNDYTTLQYSYSDGYNDSVLSSYYQLGTADEDYNYVVTSYYYDDVYTGQRKLLNDPKVQSTRTVEYTYDENSSDNNKTVTVASCLYDIANDIYTITNSSGIQSTFTRVDDSGDTRAELDEIYGRTTITSANYFTYDEATGDYIYSTGQYDDEDNEITVTYSAVDMDDEDAVALLKATYGSDYDESLTYYYDAEYGTYVIGEEIEELSLNSGSASNITVRNQDDGSVYYTDGERYITADELAAITSTNNTITLKSATETATYSNFTAVGNCTLTELTASDYEDEDIQTELAQIIKDMNSSENGNTTSAANLAACFDDDGNYIGGIYTFQMYGVTYYTTQADLELSAASAYYDDATASNGIDSQLEKLAYYKASYISTKIETTSKALLETDGNGRFTSVRFEDDSTVYTLNTETVTDEDAYNNAMNQYYYEQDVYDKAVRDINAQTEIIQAQDRTLELRLKQLDTEQNALQTEMEAVQKVVSKNVENSFKTFSGG